MKFPMALLTALALLPTAGSAKDAGHADPADPGSAVPPFHYESAFHGYAARPLDAEVSDWRATASDPQAPGKGAMGHMQMQHAPAQPQKDGGAPSGHDAHNMHNMHNMHKR